MHENNSNPNPFRYGDTTSNIIDESIHLTTEQKLGMIKSVLASKMDTQQLNSAMKEIKNILEN